MSLSINNFNNVFSAPIQISTGKRKFDEISAMSNSYIPFTQRRKGPIPPLKISEVATAIEQNANVIAEPKAKKQKIQVVKNLPVQNAVAPQTKTIAPTASKTTLVVTQKKDPLAAFENWFNELTKDLNPKSKEDLVLTKELLVKGLTLLEEIPDYKSRLGQFKKLFRNGSFWLELDKSPTSNNNTDNSKTYLIVTFKEDKEYNSEGIHYDYLGLNIPLHHYLQVFEYNDKKDSYTNTKPLLKIRSCEKNGELSWIQKGKVFSGNEILDLYRMFEPLYKGQTMYIFDDSRIEVKDTDNKVVKIVLRVLFALGRYDCKTYYENLGYNEIPALNWKDPMGTPINHKVKDYTKDRDFLRNLRMKDVYTIFSSVGVHPLVDEKGKVIKNEKGEKTYPYDKRETIKKITALLDKVFPDNKSNKFYTCEKTFHDFIEGIILLKKKNLATEEEIQQTELFLEKTLLNFNSMVPKKPSDRRYISAFETLESTVIRTKVIK
jgi:hypothetical protein